MEIDEIRNVTDFLNINHTMENNVGTLTIHSDFRPSIIDANFNELEGRINELEQKIEKLETKLNKIMFNYTSI